MLRFFMHKVIYQCPVHSIARDITLYIWIKFPTYSPLKVEILVIKLFDQKKVTYHISV